MLTLTSSTEQILRELKEEESKAFYWLKKQFHGERGYIAMQSNLIDRAMWGHKDQHSEVFEYISPRGNRWMVFEQCRYYRDIHHARTSPLAFCYYETYGSVGAFILFRWQYSNTGNETCAVLFTDHFFLRFTQRLGIEMRSRWMVQKFIEVIPGMTFSTGEELDTQGRVKVDVRLPGSIGRGIIRKDGMLIEVRTYLTDRELNRKQLRLTKKLRIAGDNATLEPMDVKMLRLAKADDLGEALYKEVKQVVSMGVDERLVNYTFAISIWIMRALIDLNYADAHDMEFWVKHGEVNKNVVIDIAKHWAEQKPVDKEFVKLFEQIFKNDNIKKYNIREFVDHIISTARENIEAIRKAKQLKEQQ